MDTLLMLLGASAAALCVGFLFIWFEGRQRRR